MSLASRPRARRSFGGRLLAGLSHTAKLAGAAHAIYQTGRALYQIGQAVAPVVAGALL